MYKRIFFTIGIEIILTLIFVLIGLSAFGNQKTFEVDFTKEKNGEGTVWLKKNGFENRYSSGEYRLAIKDGQLHVSSQEDGLFVFVKPVMLPNPDTLRIEWGFNAYPEGANYEKNQFREPMSVILLFGNETFSSGLFLPKLPYFISVIVGNKEMSGKLYSTPNYKKSGRYFCSPCGGKTGETFVTEVNLSETFQNAFGKQVPQITGIGLSADVRDTSGKSDIFVKSISITTAAQ